MGPVASQEAIKQLGHQRRRLLQRQRRASLREPEPPHQLPLDVPDLRDPRRPHLHLRADGEGPAAGLGALRRDGVPLLRGRHRRLLGGGARATRSCTRLGVERRARATWRARRSASASRTRPSTRPSPPTPPAAPSTPGTTASPRSGAWCRSSTSSWARWSSAAWARGSTGCWSWRSCRSSSPGSWSGRTPEYLGKKIETREVKLAMLYVLVFPLVILALRRLVGGGALRALLAQQRGPARALRDPLRVHERRRQQRLGLRGDQRQHALVQLDPRPDHADRPLLDDRPRPRHRRDPGRQEVGAARAGHAAHHRPALRRPSSWA